MSENRVIGGSIVSGNTHNFFVHLDDCGASLVLGDVVLTAAHCGLYAQGYSVHVGASVRGTELSTSQFRSVASEPRVHPDYFKLYQDFQLLKIEAVTKPNLVGAAVALNGQPTVPQNDQFLTAIGMGRLSQDGPRSNDLLQVQVQVETTAECNAKIELGDDIRPDAEFCADTAAGGKDTCKGDRCESFLGLFSHHRYRY